MTTGRTNPQDYLMNPGKHLYISKYKYMVPVLQAVSNCVQEIDNQIRIMYEEIAKILPEDGKPLDDSSKLQL